MHKCIVLWNQVSTNTHSHKILKSTPCMELYYYCDATIQRKFISFDVFSTCIYCIIICISDKHAHTQTPTIQSHSHLHVYYIFHVYWNVDFLVRAHLPSLLLLHHRRRYIFFNNLRRSSWCCSLHWAFVLASLCHRSLSKENIGLVMWLTLTILYTS